MKICSSRYGLLTYYSKYAYYSGGETFENPCAERFYQIAGIIALDLNLISEDPQDASWSECKCSTLNPHIRIFGIFHNLLVNSQVRCKLESD